MSNLSERVEKIDREYQNMLGEHEYISSELLSLGRQISGLNQVVESPTNEMPKVFDAWYKQNIGDNVYGYVQSLDKIFNGQCDNEIDCRLLDWFGLDRVRNYTRCVNAIINGYEVEE
ncbi:hypothetical protein [Lactobacillus terrae]|uniref:hypothetical protein n=1 Tax=Lactobacillus terrae TaxID=2269374 RepID=UPI000C1B7804|nr:hypothetical protein [Lactobacillus terrae]